MRKFIKLIIAIGISELAGIIGSLFTSPAIGTWYATLNKPTLNPPSWVFAPVWITLYALMGIALFLVWSFYSQTADGQARRMASAGLLFFSVQLLLNTFWSFIFFGLQSPLTALVEIVFLWLAILATTIAFFKVSRAAGWLLVPYIIWVSFATYLNFAIWVLN